jgi:Effector-associated domain 1
MSTPNHRLTRAAAIRLIRAVLAELYSSPEDVARIAQDAGLNLAFIRLGSTPLNDWHNVIREAEKRGRLADILQVASEEYGDNGAFQYALQVYLLAHG